MASTAPLVTYQTIIHNQRKFRAVARQVGWRKVLFEVIGFAPILWTLLAYSMSIGGSYYSGSSRHSVGYKGTRQYVENDQRPQLIEKYRKKVDDACDQKNLEKRIQIARELLEISSR